MKRRCCRETHNTRLEKVDIFRKCAKFTRAKELIDAGLYPYFLPLEDTEGAVAVYNGKRLVMAGSNNYLGLTTHPKVRQAASEALARYGTSCTGSRFLNGTLALHLVLERRLADFIGKEDAVCFSTGFQANLGVISALVGKRDLLVLDKEVHASVVDGCRLSYGTVKRFKHNDVDHLDRLLRDAKDFEGVLVVVDGVYSMGGDIAPLPRIVEACKRHGARLMVDDAHGLGVLGDGHGTARHFDLTSEVDLIMGTFSKSFASLGGVIAGSAEVIDYVRHNARSLIFSASMPASCTAAVLAALDVIESEPQIVRKLWENVRYMKKGLERLRYNIGRSETPIIPIIIGEDLETLRMWKKLLAEGVYTNPVLSPGVAPGCQMLRTSYMATHTVEHLDHVLTALENVSGDNRGHP